MPRITHPGSPLVAKLDGLHLFHFDGAPCAQRVRFALAEKGLTRGREVKFVSDAPADCTGEEGKWVSRIVSLVKKDHLTDAYAQIHPNLVVPALAHDGVLYLESMDIIAYLDEAFGGEPLVPKHNMEQLADAEVLTQRGKDLHRSIRFVTFRWGLGVLGRLNKKEVDQLRDLVQNGGDGENLVSFYEGYDDKSIPEDIYLQHLKLLDDAFADLETRLQDGRTFLTTGSLTMADVIWAMKVMRLDECGYPFASRFPAVHAWFRRLYNRPSFQSGVMGKHHFFHHAFKVKSGLENMMGVGLRQAIQKQAA